MCTTLACSVSCSITVKAWSFAAAQRQGHVWTYLQYQNRGCGNSKSREQLAKLELEDHEHILRDRRLCWIAPVERSIAAARTACIYRLMTGGEAHNDMKEPDGEILL